MFMVAVVQAVTDVPLPVTENYLLATAASDRPLKGRLIIFVFLLISDRTRFS